VILARSFNIPALVGVDPTPLQAYLQQDVQIDGDLGLVACALSEPVRRYYRQEQAVHQALREQQSEYLDMPGYTADGVRLEVAANIAHSVEASAAFGNGAEAVGLFRTEMLYMDRASAPSEDELYNIYCQATEAAAGKTIIVRTMDIGGDKPVNYLNIPAENNPFLGYRAVRIYQEFLPLFHTQLRSILRASAHGALKIMIPIRRPCSHSIRQIHLGNHPTVLPLVLPSSHPCIGKAHLHLLCKTIWVSNHCLATSWTV